MKKLVLKTALITLGSIVGVICILYGVFALFFPSKMANFYDSLGMHKGAVSFYEFNYERSNDIYDLGVLCVKVDEVEDSARAKKYLTLLIEDEKFDSYVLEFDKNSTNLMTGRELFYGKLAIAIQKTSGIEDFLEFAKSSVEDGYSEFNCFYIAFSSNGLFTNEDLVKVKNALLLIEETLDDNEKIYLQRDLEYVKNI